MFSEPNNEVNPPATGEHPGRTRFWLALLPAMTFPFLASLFYFVLFSDSPLAKAIYGGTKVFTIIWPLVCLRLIFRSRLPAIDRRDARHARALPSGIAIGLLLAGSMFLLMLTPVGAVVTEGSSAIKMKAQRLGVLDHYVLFAAFLSVVHSLIEEYYWRWFVYGRLREVLGTRLGIVFGSSAFASHHIVIVAQYFPIGWAVLMGAAVGLGGAIWCIMYERQGTLTGAWVSHMLADLGIMAIGYRLLFA